MSVKFGCRPSLRNPPVRNDGEQERLAAFKNSKASVLGLARCCPTQEKQIQGIFSPTPALLASSTATFDYLLLLMV